jgi:hypothetical protein
MAYWCGDPSNTGLGTGFFAWIIDQMASFVSIQKTGMWRGCLKLSGFGTRQVFISQRAQKKGADWLPFALLYFRG